MCLDLGFLQVTPVVRFRYFVMRVRMNDTRKPATTASALSLCSVYFVD